MSKNILQKAALVIGAICIPLIIMEAGLRLTGFWVKDSYDNRDYYTKIGIPGVPYLLKSDIHARWAKTDIITNSEGIRARREYGDKEKGVFRILAMGDSITFGMGVDQDESYPRQLERLLNRYSTGEIEYEVINGGVSGFNASDEAHFMAHLNEKYRPDMILWMLIANDYDDSLGVNDKGQITYDIPTYAATNSWLEQTWGLTGSTIDPDDFLASMKPRQQCWALGKPMPQPEGGFPAIHVYLYQHSYLYSFLSTRIKGLIKSRQPGRQAGFRDPDALSRNILVSLDDGAVDILPEISSIFISPYHQQRFYEAIEKGIRSAENRRIPLVILSFNVHLERERIPTIDKIWIEDIGQYLGMPVNRFRQQYNLGWDPHFNSKGNERLAYGVMHVMMDKGLFPSVNTGKREYLDRTAYWQQYDRSLASYGGKLESFVDFGNFKNIHQVVGGIYPPRLFPIKGNATLSLILKHPQTTGFRMAGFNGNPPQTVIIRLSDASQSVDTRMTIPTGDFDLYDVNADPIALKGSVLSVQLECHTGNCREMRIDYLGFRDN